MRPSISRTDLQTLLYEADVAARRLQHQRRLSRDDLDDLRQDFLADLIARLRGFDPTRGSLGAFAGVVMANRATRIARRIRAHRQMFGIEPVSLDEPLPDGHGATRGDLVPEDQSLASIQGHWINPIAEAERRINFEHGLGVLDDKGRRLVVGLLGGSPHRLARAGRGSRSELYRQMRELRLTLAAAGVGTAWPV